MGNKVGTVDLSDTSSSRELQKAARLPAIFASAPRAISVGGGGVQLCTREYISALELVGYELTYCTYNADRRLLARIRNRLTPHPYSRSWARHFIDDLCSSIARAGAKVVFINQVVLAPIVFELRSRFGDDLQIVLLSHGLESVDYLHVLRAADRFGEISTPHSKWIATWRLGRQCQCEVQQRREIDLVFTLAPFEAEIERWLGAKAVAWLPRAVQPQTDLNWTPQAGRLGYLGTLDHPPNYEGLRLVLDEFAKAPLSGRQLRIIGGPNRVGDKLARQYPFIDYLGPLADSDVKQEVSTWCAFMHPLFCWARGCSTKLAVAIAWKLPIIATPAGCRGYSWGAGDLPLAASPREFVRLSNECCSVARAMEVRTAVERIAGSMPSINEVALDMQGHLNAANIALPKLVLSQL